MTYYLQLDMPSTAVAGIPFIVSMMNGEPDETFYITTDLVGYERIPTSGTYALDANGEYTFSTFNFGNYVGTVNLTFHFQYNNNVNKILEITSIKYWIPDEILKSVDLNWNFDYLQTEIEKISTGASSGTVLGGTLSNDFYMRNWSSFQYGAETNLAYKNTLTDSPYGNTVVETSSYVWARGPILQLDRTNRWNAEFWVRKTHSGSAPSGAISMVITDYDSNTHIIPGDGVDWHYPLNNRLQSE
jgi:hypothetical protein